MGKVSVSKVLGTQATVGLVDPHVNMKVRNGRQDVWIVGLDSGNYHATLSMSSGGTPLYLKVMTDELQVQHSGFNGSAAYFGWPTSADSVTFGHSGVFPSPGGVPHAAAIAGEYIGGDGIVHGITY